MNHEAHSPSILLIDDSAGVREVLRVALESEGYSILEAGHGREGVHLFREHRPALVLVNIVMPEMDSLPWPGNRWYSCRTRSGQQPNMLLRTRIARR